MATIVTLDGVTPQIGADVYLAPTATLIGDVHIGDRATVWFGAVLRGDAARIEIGVETSVQDNVVVHCAAQLPTIVGNRVTVGHSALLEGCVIEDGSLIGMGAVVLQHARVGAGSLIAAGAVVSERTEIPPGVLAAGVPAKVKKELSGSSQRWLDSAVDEYQAKRRLFLSRSVVTRYRRLRCDADCREPSRPWVLRRSPPPARGVVARSALGWAASRFNGWESGLDGSLRRAVQAVAGRAGGVLGCRRRRRSTGSPRPSACSTIAARRCTAGSQAAS